MERWEGEHKVTKEKKIVCVYAGGGRDKYVVYNVTLNSFMLLFDDGIPQGGYGLTVLACWPC